ncbi:acetyl-CoA carboxylase biotin carboxyl carrier protein (plasmid) [Bosea sp. F3-2]|uniref:acetyl-CoA carboxylase biotin carboxyl carrier protein n=1 Tax=Bosea sp. F3-2 TaxID=2599640 RepID=UPI0011EBC5DA|nr:biotin/lipoyl-containing protein [Bosea sp. F3-2]QEL27343.1 acetyl-CoA carboxylase biotin carboxyl carrier protein [Bosea sp. F3-2]
MELKRIAALADLFAASPLLELEVEDAEGRVRLVKRASTAAPAGRSSPVAVPPVRSPAPPVPTAQVSGTGSGGGASTSSASIVSSPMYGTFFRAQAPGEKPFVSEGDAVEPGQTLGLIEAMKTLCKIPAEKAGRVRRILKADGEPVEEGQPLFEIE